MPSLFLEERMIDSMAHDLAKAKGKLAEIREKSATAIREGMSIAEVGAGALGFSYVNARYGTGGEYAIAGVPVDLASAVLLHGAAWFGMAGPYEEDLHMLGTGALASYLARLGTHLGSTAAAAPASAKTSGFLGTGGYGAGAVNQGHQRFVVSEVR